MQIRDVSLPVDVVGHGPPLVLMHGGPGADRFTLWPLRRLRNGRTLVLYDHRCNGRAHGAPVTSMTWENLTADADALRERLGFERWAVLGHSFGGHVALEYALRYPDRVTQLVLVDSAATSWWSQEHAPTVLASRGWSPQIVALARRWFNGEIEPGEMFRNLMRLGPAYYHHPSTLALVRDVLQGSWRTKLRPEALMFAGRHLMKGWWIVHRLPEIAVPTLVVAGASDFVFPPAAQAELVAGIPNAQLHLIQGAGHEPWSERPGEFFPVLRRFLSAAADVNRPGAEPSPAQSPGLPWPQSEPPRPTTPAG
jgi:proline iminopeptidase